MKMIGVPTIFAAALGAVALVFAAPRPAFAVDASDGESSSSGPSHGDDDNRRDNDDDDDDGKADARAAGDNTQATLAVKGPIVFRIEAQSGDVELVGTNAPQVHVRLEGTHSSHAMELIQRGDRVEVRFGDHRQLRRGHLRVEVPLASGAELTTMSGDVEVTGISGELSVRTLSGDIHIKDVGNTDVESVSGDVTLEGVKGKLRVHTVSGDAKIQSAQAVGQLAFESTSGGLKWSGACGKDCHLSAETVSGDVRWSLDPKSSFDLSFGSHSGDLEDKLDMQIRHQHQHKGSGGWSEAVYGKGEGVIECDTFSGDVTVEKR